MSTIHFDKLSMHDRKQEPISIGIPFAEGQLKDVVDFGVKNGDDVVPVQVDVTGTWDDGSVKWLTAYFEADLPGNLAHDLAFACDGSIANPIPEQVVLVTEKSEGVEIDTGVLQVVCAREGFDLFRQVVLNGKEILGPGAFSGFGIVDDSGRRFETATIDQVSVVDDGPIRALVELSLSHGVHVICQKPFAENLSDARAMVEAAERAGKYLMVHENFRWQSAVRKVIDIVRSDRIGTPFFCRASFRSGYDVFSVGAWRSLVAHHNGVVGVGSSNLLAPTNF